MIQNNWKFLLSRYCAYFFLGMEIIILPFLLPDKKFYGELEYYKSYISLIPLFLMGIHSGYLRCYYVLEKDYSTALVIGGFLLLVPLSFFGAMYFDYFILFFSAVTTGLAVFTEKIYQRKNMFLFGIMFKPIFAIINITFLYINFRVFHYTSDVVLLMSLANIIALFFYIYPSIKDWFKPIPLSVIFAQTRVLIREGFWLNIGTAGIVLIMFTDRTYLKNNFSAELSDYSLAYSVAQVLFLMFSSFAYISEVKLGEKLKSITVNYFDSSLKYLSRQYLVGLVGICIAFSFFIKFLPLYTGSWKYFILIVPSWGFFFAFGSISILGQYLDIQKRLSFTILLISLFNLVIYYYVISFGPLLSPLWWLTKTAILIFVFSIFQVLIIRLSVKRLNEIS